MKLELVPVSFREANAWVDAHHRHRGSVRGHKFSLGAALDGKLIAVVIVGRPVARGRDDGFTLEITRLCTDGDDRITLDRAGKSHALGVCSFLYAAAWRATRALGYRRLGTYTLKSESGKSLAGAGWRVVGEVRGRPWSCKSRPRAAGAGLEDKWLWEPQC